jgi:hypothetical protein
LPDLLIDLEGRDFGDPRRDVRVDVVLRERVRVGPARCWEQRLDFHGYGVKPIRGNNIVGEGIPKHSAIRRRPRGGRIVNHTFEHGAAQRVNADESRRQRRTEITFAIGLGGNGLKLVVDNRVLAELLEAEEKECLVAAVVLRKSDRTA